MITLRPAHERGHFDHGWLNTYHTFSFDQYIDPRYNGFRALRVINQDIVQPGKGFALHRHHDMEIITYVLQGAIAHEDTLGNKAIIRPGEIQRMSAGSGIRHSEYNASDKEILELLQIWILPEKQNLTPGYEQKAISQARNNLVLIAGPTPQSKAVLIHQDVKLFIGQFDAGKMQQITLAPKRYGWLQMIKGQLQLNRHTLQAGDGAAIGNEQILDLHALEDSNFLWFNLG